MQLPHFFLQVAHIFIVSCIDLAVFLLLALAVLGNEDVVLLDVAELEDQLLVVLFDLGVLLA